MKLVRSVGVFLCLAALAAAAAAQPPGRIDLAFGGLSHRATEVSDISLDGPMLQVGIHMLASKDAGPPDPQVQQVLAHLQGVYVKSFRFASPNEYSGADLAVVLRQLRAPGWSRFLSVHSRADHRNVDVYVMITPHGVAGMVIIAAYPCELRVVNLVGPVNPDALSRLGGHFGIPRVNPRSKQ